MRAHGAEPISTVTAEPIMSTAAQTSGAAQTGIQQNSQDAAEVSIWVWGAGFIAMLVWAWFRKKPRVQAVLEKQPILDAVLDIFGLGFMALLGIDGLQILATKLAAAQIPIISKGFAYILPLFT